MYFNKIIALNKNITLPNNIKSNSTEKNDILSLINEYDTELARNLEFIPFSAEIRENTLYIYRTDAYFG